RATLLVGFCAFRCGVSTSEIVTLSLHDALPISRSAESVVAMLGVLMSGGVYLPVDPEYPADRRRFMLQDSGARVELTPDDLRSRSEEHTSELQSRENLVCRLLLEKKKT